MLRLINTQLLINKQEKLTFSLINNDDLFSNQSFKQFDPRWKPRFIQINFLTIFCPSRVLPRNSAQTFSNNKEFFPLRERTYIFRHNKIHRKSSMCSLTLYFPAHNNISITDPIPSRGGCLGLFNSTTISSLQSSVHPHYRNKTIQSNP